MNRLKPQKRKTLKTATWIRTYLSSLPPMVIGKLHSLNP